MKNERQIKIIPISGKAKIGNTPQTPFSKYRYFVNDDGGREEPSVQRAREVRKETTPANGGL